MIKVAASGAVSTVLTPVKRHESASPGATHRGGEGWTRNSRASPQGSHGDQWDERAAVAHRPKERDWKRDQRQQSDGNRDTAEQGRAAGRLHRMLNGLVSRSAVGAFFPPPGCWSQSESPVPLK